MELRDVLMLSGSGRAMIGTPNVTGARVLAEVVEHGRDAKVMVFKYKNKTRYRRRHGHRQDFTRLAIRDIMIDGEPSPEVAVEKPKRTTRKASAAVVAPEVTATAVEPVAEPLPAAAPRKSRSTTPKARAKPATAETTPDAARAAEE